jgi:hypothetical protein
MSYIKDAGINVTCAMPGILKAELVKIRNWQKTTKPIYLFICIKISKVFNEYRYKSTVHVLQYLLFDYKITLLYSGL